VSSRAAARCTCVAALLALVSAECVAQPRALRPDIPHPRVAVVLSGGSAKALAHIGALEVLEELGVPIDIVTGTSMGAIVGGLYAAGYSALDLERLIDAEDWGTLFKRPTDRRLQRLYERLEDERFTITFPLWRARPDLPAGVISRQSIATHLERNLWPVHDVTDFMLLPTAFGALATDLATGDAILLQAGSLAQAIEGSAAVPGVFAPLTMADGRRVIDGAVNRNIPAEDARAMGADILICVDVSERIMPVDKLHSLVDIVDQTVAFRVQMSNAVQRPLCNVVIEPDIAGISSVEFSQGLKWVRRGHDAALAHRSALQAIADSTRRLRGPPRARRPLPEPDSVFVRRVGWSKVSPGADAIAQGAMTLRSGTWVTQQQAEATAARLFATGRFDQVSYRIVSHDTERDLTFDLAEGDRDVLGVGIRYDTPRGVALLASASVADFISAGSTASLSARLGQLQQFDARDVLGEGLNARFLQTYHATLTRATLPILTVPGTTASAVLDVRELAAQLERTLVRGVVVGLELSHEWSHDGANSADGPFALRSQSFAIVAATLSVDNRDRIVSPTRGTALFWRTEIAGPTIGGDGSFARHVVDAQGALPIGGGVSLLGSVHWGNASGTDLPLHDWFFLGGSVRQDGWPMQFVAFPGLNPQSVAGRSVQVLQAGVQAQGPVGLVVALRGNIGNVFDRWPTGSGSSGYLSGAGLSVGTELAPGPLSIAIATRSWQQKPIVEIAFGASF
jgi:NTE family protein